MLCTFSKKEDLSVKGADLASVISGLATGKENFAAIPLAFNTVL